MGIYGDSNQVYWFFHKSRLWFKVYHRLDLWKINILNWNPHKSPQTHKSHRSRDLPGLAFDLRLGNRSCYLSNLTFDLSTPLRSGLLGLSDWVPAISVIFLLRCPHTFTRNYQHALLADWCTGREINYMQLKKRWRQRAKAQLENR